ncbi:MAG: AbiV family abortive infection protein [Candidatus Nomurabacteria bacterium]|nr:AbiV family abortive infection protein [Candidatus Nomurabacteria bacterium]
MSNKADEIQKVREICLVNAEASLSVAERELDKGVDNICFHLALLALEEIGKSILVAVGYTISVTGKEKEDIKNAMDDHVKKIFWALWSGFIFGHASPEDVEKTKGLATSLHENRLTYLYTDPNDLIDPKDKIRVGEAKTLIDLTRLRLEREKTTTEVHEFNADETEQLKWFFSAQEDPEQRKQIFSNVSIEKLKEFQNGRDWIKWLYDAFKENRDAMLKLAQQELSRGRPATEVERLEPKYKLRFRIQSQSHTIRDNAFVDWNKEVTGTKIYKTTPKNLPIYAKSELVIELILYKSTSPASLWDTGFTLAKTFVNAINIGTMGLFWWNMPKDVEKYYDEITDLEADKSENIKLKIVPQKRLMIDWGEDAKMTLKKENIGEISLVVAFLMYQQEKVKSFMEAYALGLTFLSKTDIHLRLEVNAFSEFFKAFKEALTGLGDWDGKTDLLETSKKIFEKDFPAFKQLEATIQIGLNLKLEQGDLLYNITLTEVVAMKIYCDFYIKLKARDYFKTELTQEVKEK